MDDLDLLTLLVMGILMLVGVMVPLSVPNRGVRQADSIPDQ